MKSHKHDFRLIPLTIIGNYLCRYIEGLEGKADANAVDVIEVHFNALKVVISQKLTGNGGETGDKLLTGLEMVVEKRSRDI